MSLFSPSGSRASASLFAANINALFEAVPIFTQYLNGVQTAAQAREAIAPLTGGMEVCRALPDHVQRVVSFSQGVDLQPDEVRDIVNRFEILEEGHRLASSQGVTPRQMRDLLRRIVGEYSEPVSSAMRFASRPPASGTTQVLPVSLQGMLICPHCSAVNQQNYNFCHGCRAQLAESVHVAKAEKRFVTLLFTDLKGFTVASETLKPDVLGEMLNDLMRALCGAVVAHGGRVVKTIGDAVMAVWGAPKSNEDDAVNAVRAGLAMQEALDAVNLEFSGKGQPQFKMRIGVNTGEVWAGYVQGPGIYSYDLLGHEVNRAARAESACEPGRILITESTRRKLVERRAPFELVDSGALKGKREGEISEVVPTFTVVGERELYEGNTHNGFRVPLIGRGAELANLEDLWNDTLTRAHGRLVVISGEAGFGKSRLKEEFLERARPFPPDVLEWPIRGQEVHSRQPYKAVADALRAQAGISPREDAAVSQRKLRDFIRSTQPSQEDLDLEIHTQLIGNLLGIPFGERPDEVRFIMANFGLLRERTLQSVVSLFEAVLRRRKILLVLEDLHWMDAGSIEFLQALLERHRDKSLFALAMTRPEFFEQETDLIRGDYTIDRIDLAKMDREPLGDMLAAILGSEISAQTKEFLINQSGQNPFLLQEMARAIKDGWRVERDPVTQRLHFVGPGDVKVPNVAAGFLQTRIDLLPENQREILKKISILEGDFSARELHPHYTSKRRFEIPFLLKDMARKGFLVATGGERYEFAHALLKDTAYNQIPKSERKRLHARRAEHLKEHDAEPATIAHHYEAAEKGREAAEFYYLAAEAVRFYWDKSIYFYRKACELETSDGGLKFKYLRGWDNALYLSGQYEAEDEVFRLSAPLVESLHPLDQAGHHYRVGRSLIRRREYVAAETDLNRALQIADPLSVTDRTALKIKGHILVDLAISLTQSGHLSRAEELLPAAEKIGREVEDRLVLGRALWSIAHLESRRGDLFKALQATREANALFLKEADFNRYVFTLTNLGWNYCTLGLYREAEDSLRRALSLSKKFAGLGQGMESLYNSLGRVLSLQGPLPEAIEILENNRSDHHYVVFTHVYLSQAYSRDGRTDLALESAQKALEIALRRKHRADDMTEHEAIARMAFAQALRSQGDPAQALVESQIAWTLLTGLGGVEAFALEIPLTHAHLLVSLGHEEQAQSVVRDALHKLARQAGQIEDGNTLEAFIHRIDVHREIRHLAQKLGLDSSGSIP